MGRSRGQRPRIIAGRWRGRPLASPPGDVVRPTLGRVREALFGILQDRLVGCCFADIYAGTGAVGLEALSQGARLALFVEKDPRALEALRENLATFGVGGAESLVIAADVRHALHSLASAPRPDIVFADPPYARRGEPMVPSDLGGLIASPVFGPATLLVVQAARGSVAPTDLEVLDERVYGETVLLFARRPDDYRAH